MGSYCDSGGSCFTCFAVLDLPENIHCFQASTWHTARDGSDYDGTVCGGFMGSYCDPGGSCFTCFAEMDFPENIHCFQASTWHTTRDGHCYAEMDFPENNCHFVQASTWRNARDGSYHDGTARTSFIGSTCTSVRTGLRAIPSLSLLKAVSS